LNTAQTYFQQNQFDPKPSRPLRFVRPQSRFLMALVKERSTAESHACVFSVRIPCLWLCCCSGQDFSKVEMKVQKVAGTVYILEGAGGNIGASVGDDGIVMVDDEFLPLADKIEAALKGITDKPVKVAYLDLQQWQLEH
jgi:hypothetical protein